MNLTLDERTKIFDKVCHLVLKKHFDPSMNGVGGFREGGSQARR